MPKILGENPPMIRMIFWSSKTDSILMAAKILSSMAKTLRREDSKPVKSLLEVLIELTAEVRPDLTEDEVLESARETEILLKRFLDRPDFPDVR